MKDGVYAAITPFLMNQCVHHLRHDPKLTRKDMTKATSAASVLGATTGSQHECVEAGSGLLLRLASRAAACGMGCGGLSGSRASSPTSRSPPPRPPHHRPAASEISQRPEPMSALCSYAVIFLINLHLMPLNFSASLLWCAGPPPLPLSATT